jgi:Calcineurin-like phosphoesterase
MSRTLVIGDLHEPVAHPGYMQFCKDLYREFRCNLAVFIGDVVDWHAISFHDNEPECPGAGDEYEQTKVKIKTWHKAFPNAFVCIGNHDARPARLAKTVGIPEKFLLDYNTLWETPTWKWDYDFLIDEVYYCHGTGTSGIHPAWNRSGQMLMSTVMGHLHSAAGVSWRVNPMRRTFAMDVGCGIDRDTFQFVYGKACTRKPILAAGVVIDGLPHHRIMEMGRGEKYHKSRFA